MSNVGNEVNPEVSILCHRCCYPLEFLLFSMSVKQLPYVRKNFIIYTPKIDEL